LDDGAHAKKDSKFWGSFPTAQNNFGCYLGRMNTNDLTERLQDFQQKAKDQARQAAQATHEYVHENAWTSVAIAAVVGCVLGFFMGRSRD